MEKVLKLTSDTLRKVFSVSIGSTEPGFIGPFPYLLLLRWLILLGIAARFGIHWNEYSPEKHIQILSLLGITALVALFATYVTIVPNIRRSRKLQGLFIGLDVSLITYSYFLSNNTQSDFFLFYYLPIFAANEYLGGKPTFYVFGIITGLFAAVLVLMLPTDPDPNLTIIGLLLRVFLPREVFFISVVVTSSFLVRRERTQREELSRREAEVETLLNLRNQNLERRNEELEALDAVDHVLVASAPNIEPVLEIILKRTQEIVGAPVGIVMWHNLWDGTLELKAQNGYPPDAYSTKQKMGQGIIGKVAMTKQPLLVHDITKKEWSSVYLKVVPETRSELAVPIVDGNILLGVLDVQHPKPSAFSQEDLALLQTFAVQIVIAVHSMSIYNDLEQQIRSLRSLSIITSRIQDISYDTDTVLRFLLTGLTAGEGIGFSRAMLFLTSDDGTKLVGKMAIGAQTREEAEAIWARLDSQKPNRATHHEDPLLPLLDESEMFAWALRERRQHDFPLSEALQDVVIPIQMSKGAIMECLSDGKVVIVEESEEDVFRDEIERVTTSGDRGYSFACVPLVGKGRKSIGVLVVDNRFLFNERSINKKDVNNLEAYATVMAMSIENSRLISRLADEQKSATWRDFAARLAHIISTRIVAIDGAITQFRSAVLEQADRDLREDLDNLTRLLSDSIHKAKLVLRELRQYAAPADLNTTKLDIKELILKLQREFQFSENFPIDVILPDTPLVIQGDTLRLSDAFAELINNAQQSMQPEASYRECRIIITATLEVSANMQSSMVRLEFADTGPGIPEEEKKHIFDPLISTKSKGSGLGLAIVKGVIERHDGMIEECGIPGDGACFIVRLPMIS